MRFVPLFVLLGLPAGHLSADEIDDLVRAEMARRRIPGLSLAVCREGKIVKAQGYGLANVEHQVPATPDTVYQSGSVGKQLTAAAILLLVQDGSIGLDDPIGRYFEGAPGSWKPITVRHLLTHTSGIRDWEGKEDIDYRRDYTEDELLEVATGLPVEFAPGSHWSYSNTGYVLLGILVHRVTGRFYGEFLKERVFGPLGMTATRVISEADIVPNRAGGYRLEKDRLKNQEWVSPSLNTTADGSIYLTVLDLARWDAALYGERVLTRASLEESWTPVRVANGTTHPYGLGWRLDEQRGQRRIEHGGTWQGFRAHIARYVDQKLTVIVLSNLAEAHPDVIAYGVAGLLEPRLRLPDPRRPRPDPDPKRTAAVRDVLGAWAKGVPSPHMGAGLRGQEVKTAEDRSDRADIAQQLEKLESFSYLDEDDVAARGLERRGERVTRVLHYALVAGGTTYAYHVHLSGEGRVADFTFEQR